MGRREGGGSWQVKGFVCPGGGGDSGGKGGGSGAVVVLIVVVVVLNLSWSHTPPGSTL